MFAKEGGLGADILKQNIKHKAADILEEEFPMLKHNMLFNDILAYYLYKSAGAVQTAENNL